MVQENKSPRQSNIELLRILSMLGVIVLHYNSYGSVGGFTVADGANLYVLYFLECICICAVNLFVLITGYFMCNNNKRSLLKPIQLIIQVIFFSCALYILDVLLGSRTFSLVSMIRRMVPTNYFVILYIALYFVSPYVNKVVLSLNEKQLKRMLTVLIFIFSVWPTLVDFSGALLGRTWLDISSIGREGSQSGYTIVNFMLMYIVGAYIRVTEKKQKEQTNQTLIVQFLICTIIMWGWTFVNTVAWEYCNPLVIWQAYLLFRVFRNIQLKPNCIINELAKGAFTVFLVHGAFLLKIDFERYVTKGLAVMLIHIIITVSVIYIVCWGIYEVYEKTTSPLYKRMLQKCPAFGKDLLEIGETKN